MYKIYKYTKKFLNKLKMDKRKITNKCINITKRKFEGNHHIFLGEEDIRCHLFSQLLNKFDKLEKTKDGEKTITLHAQISFLDETRKLKKGKKPDIIIINVSTCNLYSDGSIEPKNRLSKGFEFEKASMGIEIKLNWIKKKRGVITEIQKEMSKIEGIKKLNPDMFFYLVYFDKVGSLGNNEIRELDNEYKYIKIIYGKPTRKSNKKG